MDANDDDYTVSQDQSQNSLSNGLNKINKNIDIADKNELKKILNTVSLLSPSNVVATNSTENIETLQKRPNKKRRISHISPLDNDDDEIQLVDVILAEEKSNWIKLEPDEKIAVENNSSTISVICDSDVEIVSEVLKNGPSSASAILNSDIEITSCEVSEKNSCTDPAICETDVEIVPEVSKNGSNAASPTLNADVKIVSDKISKKVPAVCEMLEEFMSVSLKNNSSSAPAVSNGDVVFLSEEVLITDPNPTPTILREDSVSEICVSDSSVDVCSASENDAANKELGSSSTVKTVTLEINDSESNESVDLTNGIGDGCSYADEKNLNLATSESLAYDLSYDFSHTPAQITGSFNEFSAKKNNYTRGCKWAPDGSCILTCSDDNKLRIFNLPPQIWDISRESWDEISELEVALKISEGDLIYDYCWYPLMNSNDPSTCCLVSTSRKSTVHMWDAYTGEFRCSYKSINHLDELVTPHSLCFDSDGEKLFCGFHNGIRVFDVNRPGRACEERAIYAHKNGQCGIISCFAFTSADKNLSAAGSYLGTIGLYAEPYGELSCLIQGQETGITQLQFSPDGTYLYSGGRKHPEILCYDLRNYGTVLFSLRRTVETHQRIYFDISKCGKYVVTGNQNGVITFWDVTKEPKIIKEDDFPILVPVQFYLAHDDCVNGVGFHPSYPLLCSSSGQRKFPVLIDDDDTDELFSSEIQKQDNSLRLWWIGKINK